MWFRRPHGFNVYLYITAYNQSYIQIDSDYIVRKVYRISDMVNDL
jgi:hypothetical protein